MKKSMLILILTALLSACSESENTSEKAEIFTFQTTQITSVTTTKIAEITTVSAEITTFAHQSETTTQTTAVINQQKEKIPEEPQVSERQEVTETAEAYDENHDDFSELIIENTTEKSDVPVQTDPSQIPEITSTTATEPKEYEKESSAVECGLSDYEKALEIYNFMTSGGSGTCVQYAYQTYEMCREYGLECYFAWTENQLYGHVANVVKIDGVVEVSQHTARLAGCSRVEKEKGWASSSPGWTSSLEKSTLRAFTRGGVPVLKRRMDRPRSTRHRVRGRAAARPSGPESRTTSPTMVRPPR